MKKNIKTVKEFNIKDTSPKSIAHYWLNVASDALGSPINIPLIVARGKSDYPIMGITAAVHGNELNGIPVIHRLFKDLDVKDLKGTIIGVPVINIPAYIRKKRRFNDGVDLNHIMPGKPEGNTSQVYAYRVFDRLIKHFDYLLDLHTASFGRINTYYIRADMENPTTKKLAKLQNAQIIVHNPPSDGTLRGAASEIDIPAITLEVGNPNTFQKGLIRDGLTGLHNALAYLEMIDEEIDLPDVPTVICKSSFWIYTDQGGLLTVHVGLMDIVKKGEHLATIQDIFGKVMNKYYAPEAGIVIGKSSSPVNQTGGRILHLGVMR